jgi:putative endonuclease
MRPGWRRQTGIMGEEAAAVYLEEHDYHILERNFRVTGGEIDIIARKGSEVVFVEVKTRTSYDFGLPEECISSQKIKKIRDAASIFMDERNITEGKDIRFDILSIIIDRGHQKAPKSPGEVPGRLYKIDHIKDAF